MSTSPLGSLVQAKPDEAKKDILGAIERAHGDRRVAAEALGTTHRSLYRYIERLRLWEAIDELLKEKGFPLVPGPPRAAKKIRDAVVRAEGNLPRAARALGIKIEVLRDRISALNLWEDLNRVLKAAGAPELDEI